MSTQSPIVTSSQTSCDDSNNSNNTSSFYLLDPNRHHPWKRSLEALAQLLNGEIEPLHRRCVECELARQRVMLHELCFQNWTDGKGEEVRLACIRIVERRLEKLKKACETDFGEDPIG